MRPRRRILLHCKDPYRRSLLRFALDTTMHVVIVEEFGAKWSWDFGCAVVVDDEPRVEELKGLMPVVALVTRRDRYSPSVADHVVDLNDMAAIRHAIYLACIRRRGPQAKESEHCKQGCNLHSDEDQTNRLRIPCLHPPSRPPGERERARKQLC